MFLQVNNLTKIFGGVAALNEVSFQVNQGSIFAIIGPNGAGKTTIFNLISGTLKPDRGSIIFNEINLTGLKPYQVAAAGVTRTFQNLQLFNKMTVLENVMTGAYLQGKNGFIKSLFSPPGKDREEIMIKNRALTLLEEIGLGHTAHLPAAHLPFAHKRLLEVARALMANPRLILLDEPAAGLNTLESHSLAVFLKNLKARGMTMLLIEHDMKTVMEIADRILVVNFGRVLAEGTPAEIQSNREVINAYLGEDDEVA